MRMRFMRPDHPPPRVLISHAEFGDELATHSREILTARPSPPQINAGMLMPQDARRWETAAANRVLEAFTAR